jgi:hypothetical protein
MQPALTLRIEPRFRSVSFERDVFGYAIRRAIPVVTTEHCVDRRGEEHEANCFEAHDSFARSVCFRQAPRHFLV